MGYEVELQIPPRSDHLALARLVVQTTASIHGKLTDQRIDDLRLAVSEACANSLDAGESQGLVAPIDIRIAVADDLVAVTVTDRAGGFDESAVDPIPPVTDPRRLRHERGLGIPLMRSLVDEVTFTRTADGTAVHLVVHI